MSIQKSTINIGGAEKIVICINYKEDGTTTENVSVDSLHHIHILDRSGSMSNSIDQLINNVQKTVDSINDEDILTIIWFSGSGQNRTVIKGAKKFEQLNKILDSLRSVVGCTCFSESLKEVNIILDEIGSIAPVSVTLFTDGNPVVPWNQQEEERRCYTELEKMKGRILAFNTIGYGYHYNQDMLKGFSATSEFGEFIHSSKIDDYLSIFNHNFQKVSDAVCESIEILSQMGANEIVYLNRNFTKMNSGGEFYLSRIDKRKNQFFIIGDDDSFSFNINTEQYKSNEIKTNLQPASLTNFYYAQTYNLYYQGKRKDSLDILANNLHDKALIDSHMSSFTYDECASHIKKLEAAVFDNSKRMIDGVAPKNYIPAEDAFCVLDILNYLQSSGESFYVPFSKNIKEYSRIGKKTEESINYFTWTDKEIIAPFSNFVFNKEHMNLSIRMVIPGIVTFNPKRAKALNMPLTMDSIIYRNHTIIKDGNLNIKKFEALLSDKDYTLCHTNGVVDYDIGYSNFQNEKGETIHRCIINLEGLPIINRTYINNTKSIDDIFNDVVKIAQLEARQKIIGYYLDKVDEKAVLKKIDKLADYNVEQIAFLEEHGLNRNLEYQGVGKTQKSKDECDSYQSRTMEFYLAGFSTWPKVDELLSRLNEGKKLTASLEVMRQQYENLQYTLDSKKVLLEKVNAALRDALIEENETNKKELNRLRNELAIMKIAKLLTGDWFEELKVDDKGNYFYEKDGYKMIAKTSYTTEYFN